jgi:esterase/lipase superfamily enzyme
MRRDITKWWSPNLNREMEIVAYGHHGFALLLFPTAAADYLEYERFQLIDSIKPFIEAGQCKVYSINSINSESWLNSKMEPRDKAIRHQQYNYYITEEVVPFIQNDCNGEAKIITSGASLGALHAANSFFRRPDLFEGTLAMSGVYDLHTYSKGYWDETCYFNSPVHYVPNLGGAHLELLQKKQHIYFTSGRGDYESPEGSLTMGRILDAKGIPNTVDLWGPEYKHDWPTWRDMLPHYLNTKLR